MKYLMPVLLAMIIVTLGCSVAVPKYSFLQGIAELKTVEDKYKTASENVTVAQIQSLVSELQQFKTNISKLGQSNEIRALQLWVDFRTSFLNSQISTIISKQYIDAGINCTDKTAAELGITYLKLFTTNITNAANYAEQFMTEFPTYAALTRINANTTSQFQQKAAEVSNYTATLEESLKSC